MRRSCCHVLPLLLFGFFPGAVCAQAAPEDTASSARDGGSPTGWELAVLPAVYYDADEGIGYGALAEIYDYGPEGGFEPYRLTLRPTVQLSTEGRRDLTLFFDAPHLLPGEWRVTAYAGLERQIATPYYGIGNDAPYDESLDRDDGPDPYYYRFGRTRNRITVDVQKRLAGLPLRLLMGAGASHVTVDTTPKDEGSTLLGAELAAAGRPAPGGWSNHLRAGLVWDTRDREVGPRRGVWSDVLVKWAGEPLGSNRSFSVWTATDRRYYSVADRLVFANRLLLQNTAGDPPFYELQVVQTSFRIREGLGGSETLRGIPKNRYTGKGLFVWNAELRWTAGGFALLGRSFHVVLSAFSDSGRVWASGVDLGELLTDLHHGYGGGLRIVMGQNFVAALDVGHSSEATAPIYMGLGYLF